jgi:hypothetical protein
LMVAPSNENDFTKSRTSRATFDIFSPTPTEEP